MVETLMLFICQFVSILMLAISLLLFLCIKSKVNNKEYD